MWRVVITGENTGWEALPCTPYQISYTFFHILAKAE